MPTIEHSPDRFANLLLETWRLKLETLEHGTTTIAQENHVREDDADDEAV